MQLDITHTPKEFILKHVLCDGGKSAFKMFYDESVSIIKILLKCRKCDCYIKIDEVNKNDIYI